LGLFCGNHFLISSTSFKQTHGLSKSRGQCLGRRIDEVGMLRQEVEAWQRDRNRTEAKVRWRFMTEDARIKLEKLYPVFEYLNAHGRPPRPNLSKKM